MESWRTIAERLRGRDYGSGSVNGNSNRKTMSRRRSRKGSKDLRPGALHVGAGVRLRLATLESHTFRFRDPLNKDRRFILLRLDNNPLRRRAQFLSIDWRTRSAAQSTKARGACRPLRSNS